MITAASPHEHGIVAVIVIQDGHTLCQALIIIGSVEHRNAAFGIVASHAAANGRDSRRISWESGRANRDVDLIPQHVGSDYMRPNGCRDVDIRLWSLGLVASGIFDAELAGA